ncbi:MAG: hypoxanthine phosphoribosyltransferase [Proteobacteria bacterium]|nr:hypoxanthine phosphoribosyltransferase [Pseudomonadota bacterium]
MTSRKLTTLFTEREISDGVERLAAHIAAAPLKPEIAAPILAGSFVFAADLLRALARRGLSLPVEFLWLRSYADKRVGSDTVSVLLGPSDRIHARTVLLIDGVLDRGRTLKKAHDLLLERGAASVLSTVAVDKKRSDVAMRADYAMFENVEGFIVGYGMDDAGEDRGLPYIARVEV